MADVSIADDGRSEDIMLSSMNADQQVVVHSILSHVLRHARALLLFANVNAQAARRIMAKVNRRYNNEDRDEKSFIPFESSRDQKDIVDLENWAERNLLHASHLRSTSNGHGTTILATMYHDFVDAYVKKQGESNVLRLHRLVELAGLQYRYLHDNSILDNSTGKVLMDIVQTEFQTLLKAGQSVADVTSQSDRLNRTPLHYAAEYGLEEAVRLFTKDRQSQPLSTSPDRCDPVATSPLSLAVSNSHASVISILLELPSCRRPLPCEIALIALQRGDTGTLAQLLAFGVEVDGSDARGRCLLPTAAKSTSEHDTRACEILIDHGVDVNIKDGRCSRTALTYACINGNRRLVKLLLENKADVHVVDVRGWSPIEHAAYRGHMDIVKLLEPLTKANPNLHLQDESLRTSPIVTTNQSNTSHIPRMNPHSKSKEETCVWIRLGSNDAYKPVRPVQLDAHRRLDGLPLLEAESTYTVSVAAEGDPSVVHVASLPVMESNVNKPWLFYTKDISEMKIRWNLYKQTATQPGDRKLVGSGIVLMDMLNAGIRPFRESLVRDTTVALLEPITLKIVGTVTFYYFWVTPHPTPSHLAEPHCWEFGNGIGGHRGQSCRYLLTF